MYLLFKQNLNIELLNAINEMDKEPSPMVKYAKTALALKKTKTSLTKV